MATVAVPIDVLGARPDSANTPELVYIAGTSFPVTGYAFTSGGAKALYIQIGAELYGNSGNWTLDLHWYSRAGSVTGNVNWIAALAAITPGDAQSIETKAFATSQNATITVNTTAKGVTLTQITITNLDGVNAGDDVWIKLTRGADTMAGDAIFFRSSGSYSDGNSGTAGSGDVVGPASATNTAIQVANGTSGKLLQNTPVLVDNSGNMSAVGTINGKMLPLVVQTTTDSAGVTTSATTVVTAALPGAGTYHFSFDLQCVLSTTTANVVSVAVNYSGTQSRIAYGALFSNSSAAGGGGSAVAAGTALSATPNVTTGNTIKVSGSITVSTAGNLTVTILRATSGTVVVKAGSSAIVLQ